MSSIFGTPESQLVSAIEYGNLDKVKQLIAKNPKLVNGVINEDGDTALLRACYNNDTNIINALIKAGADVNLANKKDGDTPLMSVYGVESVNALIKAGADVNLANKKNRNTPLIKNSAYENRLDTVNTLIQAGADLEAENKYGYTALITASQGYYVKPFSFEKPTPKIEIVNALIQGGANVNTKTSTGNTALKTAENIYSIDSSKGEIVDVLKKAGAKSMKKKVFTGGRKHRTKKRKHRSKRKTRTVLRVARQ